MSDWLNWPGKSASEIDGIEHCAAYHMLDVAAVAEILIAPFPFEQHMKDAFVFLVALHDIGKISDSFRSMLRKDALQYASFRHWELSEFLLYAEDEFLGTVLGGEQKARHQLYSAVAGHHGRPSCLDIKRTARAVSYDEPKAFGNIGSGREAATKLLREFAVFWPHASLDGIGLVKAKQLSWWLPGFCAAADWIGSNTRWFAPCSEPMALSAYLAGARAKAALAVQEAGLASAELSHEALFDFALRPMQKAVMDVDLPDGPMLAIIEDETGAGKTEAALLLAQRMLQAGKGQGLYFALPTMATADAIFLRASEVLGRIMKRPSLTLAHGRAGLSAAYRDLVYGAADHSVDSASCTEWLFESRRRALLANVGIGTIDQALLGILPVRHQSLRFYGLSSKILIVDEVHEMGEAYVAELLVNLLCAHRAAGGSAILLTATLPLALRSRLLSVYEGAESDPAYPALTIATAAHVGQFEVDTRPTKGPVEVKRLNGLEEAIDIIEHSASTGAACVWVRNAVDDAIAAVSALQSRGIEAVVLHSRFALCDRKRIEAEIAARVGKKGSHRAGFVVVGTQVLESSLDFDFDVMVSDIAPIAGLVQRAGRLWRHMDLRPREARPVPKPVLYVLSPEPAHVEGERWLHAALDKGAYVYPVPEIWRSAKVLFEAGVIDAPQGLRALIEAVHGAGAQEVPQALQRLELRAQGEQMAKSGRAAQNSIEFERGYRSWSNESADDNYPTRLGQEKVTVALARLEDGVLRPWAGGEGFEAWALSEVSFDKRHLAVVPDQTIASIQLAKQSWPRWKKDAVPIVVVEKKSLNKNRFLYFEDRGLCFN